MNNALLQSHLLSFLEAIATESTDEYLVPYPAKEQVEIIIKKMQAAELLTLTELTIVKTLADSYLPTYIQSQVLSKKKLLPATSPNHKLSHTPNLRHKKIRPLGH